MSNCQHQRHKMSVYYCLMIWGFLVLLNDCNSQGFSSTAEENDCVSGEFLMNGICIPCRPGTFSPLPSQDSCIECEAGTFADTTGSISCTKCLAGTHQLLRGQTSCIPCAAGFYAHVAGREWCPACWDGVVQPKEGALGCIPCKRGTYTTAWAQESCTACPKGYTTKNQASNGVDTCIPCSPGTFSERDATGETTCKPCSPGQFNIKTGSDTCYPANIGQFTVHPGSRDIEYCCEGHYQSKKGQTRCETCPVGYTTVFPQAIAKVDCSYYCAKGYYRKDLFDRTLNCTKCARGYYQDEPFQDHCKPCGTRGNVPYTTPEEGAKSEAMCILNCPAGSYPGIQGLQDLTCILCAPGSYQNDSGQKSCKLCEPGNFSPESGMTHCQACGKGQYAPQGSSGCRSCEPGTFVDHDSCASCPSGYSMANSGATNRTDCVEIDGYVGCFRDMADRDLSAELLRDRGNLTIEQCFNFCRQRDYNYAALQNGDECWCDDSHGKYGKIDESECSVRCAGGEDTCGGVLANSVYNIVVYLGCFKDSFQSRDLSASSLFRQDLTPELCFSYCRAEGYLYAALQYGSECRCDDSFNKRGNGQINGLLNCVSECGGGRGSKCGGSFANSVYRLE